MCLAVACASLAAALPAWGAAGWSTPPFFISQNFADPGPVASALRVGTNARGDTVASWLDNNSGTHVRYALRRAGGGFSAPVDVPGTGADVAVDGAGTAFVASGGGNLSVALAPPGAGFGPEQFIATGSGPRLASNTAGNALLLFRVLSGGLGVAVRAPGADTFVFKGAAPGETNSSSAKIDVAMNASGAALVTYDVLDEAAHRIIKVMRVSPDGTTGTAMPVASFGSPTSADPSTPRVAIAADGSGIVTWLQSDGTQTRVYAVQVPASGTPGPAVAVSSALVDALSSSPAVDEAGIAYVAVEEGGSIDLVHAVSAGSQTFAAPVPVSPAGRTAIAPDLKFDATGRGLVAFARPNDDVNGGTCTSPTTCIWASQRAPGQANFGAATVIADGLGGHTPRVALGGTGDAAVAFIRAVNGVTYNVVRGVAYDGAPPIVDGVSVPSEATVGAAIDMSASALDAWSTFSLHWDFGDGASGEGPGVTHAYADAGDYTVTLTATDDLGQAGAPATRSVHAAVATPTPTPTPTPTATASPAATPAATATPTPTPTSTPTVAVVCRVPKLKGKTLAAAKRLLKRNHCRLGKVTRPKVGARVPLVVRSQKPRPGTRLRFGARVALRLARR